MDLRIERCVATPKKVFVLFSESVDKRSADTSVNYYVRCPVSSDEIHPNSATYEEDKKRATLDFSTSPFKFGTLLVVTVTNVQSADDGSSITTDGIKNVGSARVNGGDDSGDALFDEAVEDLAAYPILTEEVGYPPSPIAPAGGTPATAPAQASLGGVVETTLRQLLGWKPNAGDPKAFVGALNASFKCSMVEGHTDCTWVPRTYAVQTDLSGGITGAQASLYSRTKGAVDQSLPLLDGLYSLDEEAKPEDIEALKAVAKTQLTELVAELGIPGGPRIQRVNQLFLLLLGEPQDPGSNPPAYNNHFWLNPTAGVTLTTTNPDYLDPSGILGNIRDELGLSFLPGRILVNTVEDEQDVSNFRIISDYLTSLAQSWLNNLQFFMLNSGAQPFFGTLLVLLSRQLSVIAEKVNEVRFTLDSVFVGPSERQTLILDFGSAQPRMFLEDLLSWVESFVSREGPQLIQEGGRYAVGLSFGNTVLTLLGLVQGAEQQPRGSVPDGYLTPRVQRSMHDLSNQLQDLYNLTTGTNYQISPEPPFHMAGTPAKYARPQPLPRKINAWRQRRSWGP